MLGKVCSKLSPLIKAGCKSLIETFSNAIIEQLQDGADSKKVCQAIKLCKKTSISTDYALSLLAPNGDETVFTSPQLPSEHPSSGSKDSFTGNPAMCNVCKKVIKQVVDDIGSDKSKVGIEFGF